MVQALQKVAWLGGTGHLTTAISFTHHAFADLFAHSSLLKLSGAGLANFNINASLWWDYVPDSPLLCVCVLYQA